MKGLSVLFVAALSTVLSVQARPVQNFELESRAKVGPKPPAPVKAPAKPAAPVKPIATKPITPPGPILPKPPAPKPAPPPKAPVDICVNIASCLACTKNRLCGFNPTTLKCAAISKGGANLVTARNPQQCPPLKQQSTVDPTLKSDDVAKAQTLLTALSPHIFVGEPTSTTSGRHIFSAWRPTNRDAGRCDTTTNICAFGIPASATAEPKKTVFDDRAGKFTKADVSAMCLTAIKLNLVASKGTRDGSFVVQTKFGRPICIRHQVAGKGSCFPIGIHSVSGAKLGAPCTSSGQAAVTGRNEELAAL